MPVSTRLLATVLVAVLTITAGCTGGDSTAATPSSGDTPEATTESGGAGDGGPSATDGGGTSSATGGDDSTTSGEPGSSTDAGTGGYVDFYVSDRPQAIDDFRHLNVTVARVGFERAGGGWVEREAENVTVDLTRLVGANASLVDRFEVPNGSYQKVFLYASDVEGILTSGERTRVKLPSGKLQVKKGFTVGPNSSVEFVFDVAVHEAGKSGKYILRPVLSESGTDVQVDPVDRNEKQNDKSDERGGDGERGNDDGERGNGEGGDGGENGGEGRNGGDGGDGSDRDSGNLSAKFLGRVTPGENATLRVARANGPVANATVLVDDRRVGVTDERGRATVAVPADAETLTVIVRVDERELELEREFEDQPAIEPERALGGPALDLGPARVGALGPGI